MKAKRVVYLLIAMLSLSACTSESLRLAYSNQDVKIDNYVNSQLQDNPEMRVEYCDGAVRLVIEEGEGEALKSDGTVAFLYAGYNFSSASMKSSDMFATNNIDVANAAKWNITDSTLFDLAIVDLAEKQLVEGLQKGMVGVKGGEECVVLFSGKYAYGKKTLGTIPANAPIAFHLWINEIENK